MPFLAKVEASDGEHTAEDDLSDDSNDDSKNDNSSGGDGSDN